MHIPTFFSRPRQWRALAAGALAAWLLAGCGTSPKPSPNAPTPLPSTILSQGWMGTYRGTVPCTPPSTPACTSQQLALTLLPAGYLLYSAGQNPALVRNYSLASVDTLAGQVGGGEYLPAALSAENAWVPPAVVPEDGLAAEVVQSGELRLTLALANTAGAGRGVTLPLFFYPGYTARDAAGAALSLANAGGYLRLVVPAGYSGTVTVRFAGFWFWRLADLFSLAAVAFAVWQGQKNRRAARRGA